MELSEGRMRRILLSVWSGLAGDTRGLAGLLGVLRPCQPNGGGDPWLIERGPARFHATLVGVLREDTEETSVPEIS